MTQNAHCTYELIDGTIHHFTLVKADQQAMDEFLPHMAQIFDDTPSDGLIYLLVDFRPDGIPPLRYAVNGMREMIKARDGEPAEIRAAYLHEPNLLVSLVTTFLDRLRLKSKRKLFSGEHAEAEALAWLKEGQN